MFVACIHLKAISQEMLKVHEISILDITLKIAHQRSMAYCKKDITPLLMQRRNGESEIRLSCTNPSRLYDFRISQELPMSHLKAQRAKQSQCQRSNNLPTYHKVVIHVDTSGMRQGLQQTVTQCRLTTIGNTENKWWKRLRNLLELN